MLSYVKKSLKTVATSVNQTYSTLYEGDWILQDGGMLLKGTNEVTAKNVWDAVKAGDELAIEAANVYGEYLGKGLAAVACVVNPQIFVIGGGVSKAGDVLIEYMKPYYEKYVFHGCKDVKFALATLGNDAGIYGSAKLVLE